MTEIFLNPKILKKETNKQTKPKYKGKHLYQCWQISLAGGIPQQVSQSFTKYSESIWRWKLRVYCAIFEYALCPWHVCGLWNPLIYTISFDFPNFSKNLYQVYWTLCVSTVYLDQLSFVSDIIHLWVQLAALFQQFTNFFSLCSQFVERENSASHRSSRKPLDILEQMHKIMFK